MRRGYAAVLALVATVLIGAVALTAHAAHSRSTLAQTLGVAPAGPVATLQRGQQLCETPIALASRFQRVQFFPTAARRATPSIAVTLRDVDSGALVGRGQVARGFAPTQPQTVAVGDVPAGRRVSLCFRDTGPGKLDILGDALSGRFCTPTGVTVGPYAIGCAFGWARPTLSTSAAVVGKTPLDGDVAANFLRDSPRSLLSQVPAMLQRASLFKPAFAGRGLWVVLIVAWLVLAPAGLAYALRASARGDSA